MLNSQPQVTCWHRWVGCTLIAPVFVHWSWCWVKYRIPWASDSNLCVLGNCDFPVFTIITVHCHDKWFYVNRMGPKVTLLAQHMRIKLFIMLDCSTINNKLPFLRYHRSLEDTDMHHQLCSSPQIYRACWPLEACFICDVHNFWQSFLFWKVKPMWTCLEVAFFLMASMERLHWFQEVKLYVKAYEKITFLNY